MMKNHRFILKGYLQQWFAHFRCLSALFFNFFFLDINNTIYLKLMIIFVLKSYGENINFIPKLHQSNIYKLYEI